MCLCRINGCALCYWTWLYSFIVSMRIKPFGLLSYPSIFRYVLNSMEDTETGCLEVEETRVILSNSTRVILSNSIGNYPVKPLRPGRWQPTIHTYRQVYLLFICFVASVTRTRVSEVCSFFSTVLSVYSAHLRIWVEYKTVGWTNLKFYLYQNKEWLILNTKVYFH